MPHFKISYDEWESSFKPVKNHIDDNASWSGLMFETYGEEFKYVKEREKTHPNTVWTLTECESEDEYDEDGDPKCIDVIGEGLHFVNRLGYFITEEPYVDGVTFEVTDD